MPALYIPLSTYAHDDRAVGVLLHRDDARLLTLAGGRRGVLQRALNSLNMDNHWGASRSRDLTRHNLHVRPSLIRTICAPEPRREPASRGDRNGRRLPDQSGEVTTSDRRGLDVTIGTRTHRARRRVGSGWRGELLPQSSLLSGASRACDGRSSIAWRGRRSSKTIATFRWKFGHCVKSSYEHSRACSIIALAA